MIKTDLHWEMAVKHLALNVWILDSVLLTVKIQVPVSRTGFIRQPSAFRHDGYLPFPYITMARSISLNIKTVALKALMAHPQLLRFNKHGWRISTPNKACITLRDYKSELTLEPFYAILLLREEPDWAKYYLPVTPLGGKTVMDVGAGCGETAWFFFSHGASKVIGVEPNADCVKLFEVNQKKNGWNAQILAEEFQARHLSIPHDFLKVDCEGGESALLDAKISNLGPCRLELHGSHLTDTISKKFGLTRIQGSVWGSG